MCGPIPLGSLGPVRVCPDRPLPRRARPVGPGSAHGTTARPAGGDSEWGHAFPDRSGQGTDGPVGKHGGDLGVGRVRAEEGRAASGQGSSAVVRLRLCQAMAAASVARAAASIQHEWKVCGASTPPPSGTHQPHTLDKGECADACASGLHSPPWAAPHDEFRSRPNRHPSAH
jgi:hypothetical protein